VLHRAVYAVHRRYTSPLSIFMKADRHAKTRMNDLNGKKKRMTLGEDFKERCLAATGNLRYISITYVRAARLLLPLLPLALPCCLCSSIRRFIFAIAIRGSPVNDEECYCVATEKFKTPTPRS